MTGNPETPHDHPLPELNLHDKISEVSFLVEEVELGDEGEKTDGL